MKSKLFQIGKAMCFLVLALSLGLTGCTPSTPVVVTQDPAVIVEMVVKTVDAQMTAQALLNPTATDIPTQTPLPTATFEPTFTPTFTLIPATNTPAITDTPIPALLAEVQYVTPYPVYKHEFIPNETFSLGIGFKNGGTVTWESGYTLKIVGFEGEITCQKEATTSKTVAPGEKVQFDLWAYGSEILGKHVWYYQLYNSSGLPVPGGYASFTYTSK